MHKYNQMIIKHLFIKINNGIPQENKIKSFFKYLKQIYSTQLV